MAFQDRHYHRDDDAGLGRGGGYGSRFSGKSVVTWLLILNVVVFLFDAILTSGSRVPRWMSPYLMGRFSIDEAVEGFQLWRVVTYQFLHADFFHILFNMIGLYFFGPLLEQWWGSRRFLAFYLLCGIGGVVPYTAIGYLAPGIILEPGDPQLAQYTAEIVKAVGLIGASGSIYGILIGCAVLFPRQEVRLIFPPIPMKMRTMALIFLGIAFFSVLAGTPNAGGQLAHLGGALFGFLLVRYPGTLNAADRFSPQAVQQGINKGRYERKIKREHADRTEIDRILAKVSAQGLQSLTKREKKLLKQDTERLNQ